MAEEYRTTGELSCGKIAPQTKHFYYSLSVQSGHKSKRKFLRIGTGDDYDYSS